MGVELRNYRLRAGETSAAAAKALGCSPGKITHLETGRYFPQPEEIAALLEFYDAPRWDVDRLSSLAGRADNKTWWAPWTDVLPDWLKTFVGLEGIASSEFIYIPLILPGLLQTPEYAAALTAASVRVRPDHNERLVSLRLARQQRLIEESPLGLVAVVEESVLDRPVGTGGVMRQQMEHLLEVVDRSHVELRVLPTSVGPHAALSGGFMLLHFVEAQSIGYVEIPDGAVYVQDQDQVTAYIRSSERLLSVALSSADSVKAIEERLAVYSEGS
ncbi:transcriptional regulator with XRE-family HTH domain [Saccharopolyspora lacisalsi]|uniref:Transcriptional regulator with XRE-family HTH domain n=1 Tax=Halosaccharopolyspora lacisalsi TaxID=1000566 RepID=A0A839DQ05_9PSEU|nr:helix-turn-helix transcriptional regulator [Halosaccharopolyspora lacisalsi]MBA8823584.1 transcriptional regulator with XRE-family HTH domain [Halosaccharopolyspora lacisalsi]